MDDNSTRLLTFKNSKYFFITEEIERNESDVRLNKKILYSTRTARGILVTEHVIDLLQSGAYERLPDNTFTNLMYYELLISQSENELDEIIARNSAYGNDVRSAPDVPVYTLTEFVDTKAEKLSEAIVWVDEYETIDSLPIPPLCPDHVSLVSKNQFNIKLFQVDLFKSSHFYFDVHTSQLEQIGAFILNLKSTLHSRGPYNGIHLYLNIYPGTYPGICRKLIGLSDVGLSFFTHQLSDEEEIACLNSLRKYRITGTVLPTVKRTLSISSTDDPISEILTLLGAKTTSRPHYDAANAGYIKGSMCGNCQYLPMCGGIKDKLKNTLSDCPAFIRNFEDKVRFTYNYPLNQPRDS